VCTVGVDYSHKNSLLINQATIGFRFHMRTMWAAGFLWIHETTGAQHREKGLSRTRPLRGGVGAVEWHAALQGGQRRLRVRLDFWGLAGWGNGD
jgi:hypothetical protein